MIIFIYNSITIEYRNNHKQIVVLSIKKNAKVFLMKLMAKN